MSSSDLQKGLYRQFDLLDELISMGAKLVFEIIPALGLVAQGDGAVLA